MCGAACHDHFELTHRFGAWLALALVWVNTVLLARARHPGTPTGAALIGDPDGVAAGADDGVRRCGRGCCCAGCRSPSSGRPTTPRSSTSTTTSPPTIGTTRAISRHPLIGWHHFAVVPPAAGRTGYRMVVSRAGDWTGAFVDDPPAHVWVRGLPAVGVANVRRLFDKVVFVVTGSGIGPALSHLLADEMPTKLVWVTKEPRAHVRRRVRRRGPAPPSPTR